MRLAVIICFCPDQFWIPLFQNYPGDNISLFIRVDVWVLPGDDVVSEEAGQQVDLEEVFVQIFPLGPGGNLVHGLLRAGRLSVHGCGLS